MRQQIKLKNVINPSQANPTPRPSTAAGRPLTASVAPGDGSRVASTTDINDFQKDIDDIYNSVITPEFIIGASSGQNLEDIVHLAFKINTSEKSICNMGDMLPSLRELVMDGSYIASIRDLGTSLMNLRTLSMNDCGISELDGIGALVHLEMLLLRNNNISDICPLAMHGTNH